MRGKLVLAAILFTVLIFDASAERIKGRRRVKKPVTPAPEILENGNEIQKIEELERVDEENFHESQRERARDMADQIYKGVMKPAEHEETVGACSKIHCSAGKMCDINDKGEAECVCVTECQVEVEDRRKVCTNHNETWSSDCEVHRQRCICMTDKENCKDPKYSHAQIDYYGVCRQMPECNADEMADFPRRMRDWLFNVMRDLADRHELSEHYMEMESEAETNLTRRWTNAAIWKWCDLDADDNDKFVSRHELFPIRAPLLSLEHCIGPFLNSCDYDDDHRISLKEWGKCLELDESEIIERCDDFNDYS